MQTQRIEIRMCGDEIARRDAAALARRLTAARFETTCAVEDFAFNPGIPAGVIRDLATLRFLRPGRVGDPARPGCYRGDDLERGVEVGCLGTCVVVAIEATCRT